MRTSYKWAIAVGSATVAGLALWPQAIFGQDQGSGHNSALDRIVTKRFDNANVNQVFAWLVENGFSYVAKDNSLDTARVSLNIDHESVWDAAQALADALGGHWTKDGKVYVFHRNSQDDFKMDSQNRAFILPDMPATGQGWSGNMTPDQQKEFQRSMGDWAQNFAKSFADGKSNWGENSPQMKEFGQQMEQFGKSLGDQMKDMPHSPDGNMTPEQERQFKKAMGNWAQNFGNSMKGFSGDMPMQGFDQKMGDLSTRIRDGMKSMPEMPKGDMTPEQKQAFKEKMQKWGEDFGKQFENQDWAPSPEQMKKFEDMGKMFGDANTDFKNMPGMNMSPEQMKKFQEGMQQLGKGMGNFDFKNMPNMPEGNMSPEQQKAMAEKWQEWAKQFSDKMGGQNFKFISPDGQNMFGSTDGRNWQAPNVHVHVRRDGSGENGAFIGGNDLKSMIQSLTPSQQELMNSRGYLTPGDLTDDQRAYFHGLPTEGDWEFKFNLDGQKLDLKSR